MDIEIVDAVRGDAVPDKVIPHPEVGRFMKAEIGCWRSHMNVMQQFVFNRAMCGSHGLTISQDHSKKSLFRVDYRR